jgi:competence protein ComEC
MVLSYGLFLLFGFVRRGPRFRLGLPTLLSLAGLAVLLFAVRLDYVSGPATIAALDVGQGQCLAVMSGESTLLIDCGGLGTVDDAGETAGRFLISRGRKRVDALLLTHWDSDHCNGLPMLLEMCPVRLLLVPAVTESDSALSAPILESAARHGTELVMLENNLLLELGEIRAQIYAPTEPGGNDACAAALVSVDGYDMLVTGDMSAKKERELLTEHPLEGIELYIVGHHGSKYASSAELLVSIGAETAIVSCGYNTYGHPAQETLERLASCGYTVYRTDENGTIEIRIGTKHG